MSDERFFFQLKEFFIHRDSISYVKYGEDQAEIYLRDKEGKRVTLDGAEARKFLMALGVISMDLREHQQEPPRPHRQPSGGVREI